MMYRIFALAALFFFTACSGGPREVEAPIYDRKSVQQFPPASPYLETGHSDATPAQPETAVIKVGLLVPLTGEASAVGNALMDAATLALMDRYGAANSGQPLTKVVLVPKDTQGTPAGAARAAQEVLAAGAQLIVGPLFSQNVSAVAPIARQYGVNVLTFSNNPEVASDNVFIFGFQVEQQVRRVLNYALNNHLTRIALLAPNNAYGGSVQQTAVRLMTDSGLGMASEQYYNPASDAAQEVAQLSAIHHQEAVDALLIPEGGQKLIQIIRSLQAHSITQPPLRFLGTGLWDEPQILRSGVLTGGWFASSPPERFTQYEQRFSGYFGYTPPRISALAYDAMALAASLAITIEGAKPFSAAVITDPAGYNGPVNGIFRCAANGLCERGLAVLEVTGSGSVKVLDAAPRSFR